MGDKNQNSSEGRKSEGRNFMDQMAKWLLFGAAALSLTTAGCFPAAAASIDRVRIRLTAETLDEMGLPVLEAESRDKAYAVTGVERISGDLATGPAKDEDQINENESKEKEAGGGAETANLLMQNSIITEGVTDTGLSDGQPQKSTQVESENPDTKKSVLEEYRIEDGNAEEPAPEILYEIELESDTDDSFSILRQEDIQFSGLSAECSKAIRKDNGTTLLLTIELQEPGEIMGTVDAADWAERGNGRWEKAPGASAYLVMLYRDAKRVGHPHRTSAEQYDFAPLMQEAGVYHFKVMPLTKRGKRGRATESVWRKVTEEEAGQNREQWSGKKPGWQPEGESPSYILRDGAYPQMDSLLIAERYEQFNENGEKMDES